MLVKQGMSKAGTMSKTFKFSLGILFALLSATTTFSASSAKPLQIWQAPLNPPLRLVNEYRQPNSDYSAGHRGVDYWVRLDQMVLAPADGQVVYANRLNDRAVLSLNHGNQLLTEYEPVCSDLPVGEIVFAGQEIGRVCDADDDYREHCSTQRCMHFSVRQNGRYLSPLIFLGLANPSRLLPIFETSYALG